LNKFPSLGFLLANQTVDAYSALMTSVIPDEIERAILVEFLDFQWENYLSRQVPKDYAQELTGVQHGGNQAGVPEVGTLITRGITISSFPGDVANNIAWLIYHELLPDALHLLEVEHKTRRTDQHFQTFLVEWVNERLLPAFQKLRMGCSFLGVWGSRTESGELFSGRNLDWAADTGLASFKLITVYHPPDNLYSHTTVGFCGLYGSLTGMSSQGVTVHEAGDDNQEETFLGFPWVLRLRYVMEHAKDLGEASKLWSMTNNTMGINHGIGSAHEGIDNPKFLVLETKAFYTAYFNDNDTREYEYVVDGVQYGFPLKDAVWRTNHGYDPTLLSTATYITPLADSEKRYMLIHDSLVGYENREVLLSYLEAVNVTAIVGDKGGSFLSCNNATLGINILSVAYAPSSLTMYVAFEEGSGFFHKPACCSTYVVFNMSKWLI